MSFSRCAWAATIWRQGWSAASLRWFRDRVAGRAGDPLFYAEMDELAANVPAGANGLLFYPYLQGAGPDTPGACGVFAGLFGSADRASMWRAILEAIAFEYAQMIKIYRECGIPLDEIIGTEGGSKSPLWTQIKADILRGAYNIPARSEGGLMADAAVAAYAVGDISDIRETMREWTRRIVDTHYCLGSVMGPHPFPMIVRDFQAVISSEIKAQFKELKGPEALPDMVIACVGGGSNAIGAFYHFIDDFSVQLVGCEAAGRGVDTKETAATIATGRLGIFHGMKSYFCQDEYGQIAPVYSISAGLDYPGIGPEHAYLHDMGRAQYVAITDDEAVDAFEYLAKTEGIIPAIESAHAVAYALKVAPTMRPDQSIVINISGRGDKDCAAIARYRGEDIHE